MKITGKEYKNWYENHKPENFSIEYQTIETRQNDEWIIEDNQILDSNRLGGLIWDGDPENDPTGGRGITITKAIKESRKQDNSRTLLIEIPAKNQQEFIKLIKDNGGKIITK